MPINMIPWPSSMSSPRVLSENVPFNAVHLNRKRKEKWTTVVDAKKKSPQLDQENRFEPVIVLREPPGQAQPQPQPQQRAQDPSVLALLPPAHCPPPRPRPRLLVLPYAGMSLDDPALGDVLLPRTLGAHDLAENLVRIVSRNVADEAVMDAQRLLDLVTSEIFKHGIVRKAFARKMGVRPSTFSTYVCDSSKTWAECGPAHKRFLLNLFFWLNLDCKDRLGAFFEAAASLEVAGDGLKSRVEAVPKLDLLVGAVKKEMETLGVTVADLAGSVVRGESADVVENLIRSPLCWSLMPNWMKKCYGDLWYWLRCPTADRVMMLAQKEDTLPRRRRSAGPDTRLLCSRVLQLAEAFPDGLRALSDKVFHLSPYATLDLLRTPPSWDDSGDKLRFIFVSLMKWVSADDEERMRMRPKKKRSSGGGGGGNNGGIVAVASTVPSAAGGVNRFPEIKAEPPHQPHNHFPIGGFDFADLDEVALDTAHVAAGLLGNEPDVANSFAKALCITVAEFDSLMRMPVTWESATRRQKIVYRAAWEWLGMSMEKRQQFLDPHYFSTGVSATSAHGHRAFLPHDPSLATKNVIGRHRHPRVRFTEDQMSYLKRMFDLDPRPSTAAKKAMSEQIGLTLRTIMVFFSNRRRRVVIDKESDEKGTEDKSLSFSEDASFSFSEDNVDVVIL